MPLSSSRSTALAICLIVAAGLLAYADGLAGPFVYDDQVAILQNPTIRHLWDALRPPHGRGITVEGRPVLNFSLALNYAISGTAVWSYHALNLLIHICAGLALFGIVRRTLLGDTSIAFAVALLWTVHPLQTEAVTYVIQRAESLMGLFYLLTLYCFIRASTVVGQVDDLAYSRRKREQFAWFALSCLACFFGMGTKEVTVSAPLIVLLYDRIFVGGSFAAAWRLRRGYYLGMAATWILLAGFVVSGGGNRNGSVGFGNGVSWYAYALTQFQAIVRYLRLSFWPHPLVFDYGTFWISNPVDVAPSALLTLALLGATVWALRFRPALGFLGAFFFAILAPTSLLPGTTQMIVEHRMYLPLAAVLTAAAIGAARFLEVRIFTGAACAAAVALGAVTVHRNADYRTELGLWADTVAKRPDNIIARNNLGICLNEAGRPQEAIAQFEQALRTNPDFVEAHNDFAVALDRVGRTPDAIAEYEQAVRLKPDWAEARYNLGVDLAAVGRSADAVEQYEAALRIRPDFAEAHSHLGAALAGTGRIDEAIDHFGEAVRIRPGSADDRYDLGVLLGETGRVSEAVGQLEEAARLKPDWAEAHYSLGVALGQAGRQAEAIVQFQQALRIRPDFAEARAALRLLNR